MTDTTSTRPQMGDFAEHLAKVLYPNNWENEVLNLRIAIASLPQPPVHAPNCNISEKLSGDCSCGASTPAQSPAHDEGHPHLIGGEFQSDKYPTTPRGKVPLSVKDKTAQDLLWTYAQRRRVDDGEFANDLELALTKHGFVPSTPALCEDEGCPHYGTAHVCVSTPAQSVLVEALHKISNPFDHGHCGTCGKECAGATDCDCSFPVWEQDNPIAIAKAALSHAPFQPALVVESANVKLLREATLLLQNVEDSFPMNAELPGWLRDCRKRIEAIASSPQPDGEGEIREGIVRDRAYGNGMKQALREIWPLVKEAPGVVDAIAKKMGELDKRADQFSTDALTAFTSSNSPQATEEGK